METKMLKTRKKTTKKSKKKKLKCETCNAILKSEYFYKRHQETAHRICNFICDYDGKTFLKKNYLRIHMERHKEQVLACKVCYKAYNSKVILRRHLLSHLKKFLCSECGATFNHKSLYNNHITIHKNDFPYKCKYCTRLFRNLSSRNNHHQIAHKNKNVLNFMCDHCKVYFETKEDLRIHSFIHFNREIKSCHYCDQIFKTTKSLNIHLQKHSEKKNFQCESCLECFTFKSGLRKHVRLNRCKGPPISLNNSDEDQTAHDELVKIAQEQLYSITTKKDLITNQYEDEENLEEEFSQDLTEVENDMNNDDIESLIDEPKNVQIKDSINEKRKGRTRNIYICDKCGESIKYRKNLELHMKKSHLKRTYHCHKCSEIFEGKIDFRYHSINIHGISRLYTCNICKTSFKSSGNLKRHSLIHSEERNFLCDACPKCFKSQLALKIHKDSVHASVKYFVSCPYCKAIIQEKNLKIHIFNQHTEEGQKKNFCCNLCDKTFKNEFLLKRHTELLHFSVDRGVIYGCKDCGLTFNRQRDLRAHSLEQHFEGPIHMCFCGKKFKNKRLLLIHSTVHANDTKFPCTHCDAVFKTSGGRRKHVSKYHKQLEEDSGTKLT